MKLDEFLHKLYGINANDPQSVSLIIELAETVQRELQELRDRS